MGVAASDPLYVCMYVPEFPAQTLLRLRAKLMKLPAVVLAGIAPFEQVCSCNRKARLMGVTHGMTRTELDVFPGLSHLKRSEPEEDSAQSILLEAAHAFTPRVQTHPTADASFCMVLDMAGTSRIFGTTAQLASRLATVADGLGFSVQIAASANYHTAVCLSLSSTVKPTIVPSGSERTYLAGKPVSHLGLTGTQSETLALWGVHIVGDLASLPVKELISRLGQEGKRLHLLARGEYQHVMTPEEPAFDLVECLEFDAPLEMLESLLFVLGPMIDQLLLRAQSRSFALASLSLRLHLEEDRIHERTVRPALPVLQRDVLLKLMQLDLQAHPPGAGILRITLRAETGDRSKVQLGLFSPQLPEPTRLDVTLARIASIVGHDRVGSPQLVDTHKFDSFTMQTFALTGTRPLAATKTGIATALRQFRPAVPVAVQAHGHHLQNIFLWDKYYIVQHAYGPWLRSGEWWSGGVWSLEEWDVCARTDGEDVLLCVLAHDPLREQWQVQALYD